VISVLVVDDQPVVAQVHAQMVDRVDGFRTVGVAHDGQGALTRARGGDVDLVLLDLTMPGMDGIEVCRRLHALPRIPDIVVVTAVRDMETVRAAVTHGAMLYLVKPFTFSTLKARLLQYASFRQAAAVREAVDQRDIDDALATLRPPAQVPVPKTLSPESLDTVRAVLREAPEGLTAVEVAERTGMARVTARRYLEHLTSIEVCVREPVYGRAGRPLLRYRMRVLRPSGG